jgi:hypothetical protein
VLLPYIAVKDKEAVNKLDLNKKVNNSALDTLKEVNAVAETDLKAGILA